MKEFLLNSPSFHLNSFYNFLSQKITAKIDKYLGYIGTILFTLFSIDPVKAAQGDKIITIIKTLTQDIYADFVYVVFADKMSQIYVIFSIYFSFKT